MFKVKQPSGRRIYNSSPACVMKMCSSRNCICAQVTLSFAEAIMAEQDESTHSELAAMRRRLDLLERENQRLRERIEPFAGPDNPCFDPGKFQHAFQRIMLRFMLPTFILPTLVPLLMLSPMRRYVPHGFIG